MMSSPSIGLSAGWWTQAEFNVYGAGGSAQATFQGSPSIVVQELIDSVTPTENAPTCTTAGSP